MPRYLLQLIHQHLDFRLAELDALLEMAGVEPRSAYDRAAARTLQQPLTESPFLVVELPDEEAARRVVERAVLVKVRAFVREVGGIPFLF